MLYTSDMIGTDIKRTVTGDMAVSLSGDIDLTSGTNNVIQAINSALMTYKGFDAYVPEYGSLLLTYVGQPNSSSIRYAVGHTIREALEFCPKVAEVTQVNTTKAADDVISTDVQIIPITEDSVINYTYPLKV